MLSVLRCAVPRALFTVFLALAVHAAAPAHAQIPGLPQGTGQQAPDPASSGVGVAELENLVKTIENEEDRKKLLEQLRALIAAQTAEDAAKEEKTTGLPSRFVTALADRAKEIHSILAAAAGLIRDADKVRDWFTTQAGNPETRAQWLKLFYKLAAVLVTAVLVGWLVRRLLARPRRTVESRNREGWPVTLLFLLLRTILDVMPIAAAGAAGYVVLPLTDPNESTRLVVITLINAYVVAEVVMVLGRMVLAPRVSALRLVPASGETANYLYIWTRRFDYTIVYVYYLTVAAGFLGLPGAGQRLVITLLGLAVAGMAIVFVLQNRRTFGDFIRAEETGDDGLLPHPLRTFRNRLADIWHALAVIYIAAVYFVWALRIENGFENFLRSSIVTVVALVVTMTLNFALHKAIRRGFAVSDELKQRYPGLEGRANRYLSVLDRILRTVLWLIAAVVILQTWGADILAWLEGPSGSRFISAVASIIVVLVIALVVWEGASAAIERYLRRAATDAMALARRDRARTLLPLLRNVIFFVISVLVVLVILAEIGVNIGPLLAGAGIVGLAIGFGAQKLVQDIITGAFMVFEDAVAVGDVVTAAGATGIVEAMSIRSLRLRDLSGNVHTIPFSAVDQVSNMTKEFSYYIFDVGVAYRENVDEVIEVLKALGEEMQAEPEWGPKIMEPLEILGLNEFGNSAIVIRARFKTLPIEQWRVGREFNRRIKNKFDELGIEIPFPHQTLYFGEDKDGRAPAAPIRLESGPPPEAAEEAGDSEAAEKPAAKPPLAPDTGGQAD